MRQFIAAVLTLALMGFASLGPAQSCGANMSAACPLDQCASESAASSTPCHQSLSRDCCDGQGCLESPACSGSVATMAAAKAPVELPNHTSLAAPVLLNVAPVIRAPGKFAAVRPPPRPAVPLFLEFRSFLI